MLCFECYTFSHCILHLLGCKHQVNHSFIVSPFPCFGSAVKETGECKFSHQVNDQISFSLSLHCYIISAPQLVMSVEISCYHYFYYCVHFSPHLQDCLL